MTAIVINLDDMEPLMLEYIHQRGEDGSLLKALLLSDFLIWLKENYEQEKATPSFSGPRPVGSINRRPASYRLGSIKK